MQLAGDAVLALPSAQPVLVQCDPSRSMVFGGYVYGLKDGNLGQGWYLTGTYMGTGANGAIFALVGPPSPSIPDAPPDPALHAFAAQHAAMGVGGFDGHAFAPPPFQQPHALPHVGGGGRGHARSLRPRGGRGSEASYGYGARG
jgi:hypothetical protein